MNVKRPTIAIMTLCMAGLLVSACGVREQFIQGKQAPDEFAVYSRAPLSIPPEYNLRAPEPGVDRPQEVNPEDIAQQVILGSITNSSMDLEALDEASGIQVLLRDAGALDVDHSIREIVNKESSVLAEEDQTVMESIMYWKTPSEYGSAVDPTLENKRIQENQALGQPLTTGEVPIIEKKHKGLLDDLF
ncbi:MAG: DUF3035 domain-containing protein [Rhodospirillales bacterium]|jgi:hypothetical protein|nr:DUF3035 domain-containing protein [Rhodospirillales bacterium]